MATLEKSEMKLVVLLRVALGWLLFWAGITKVLNPDWTAQGYLMGAKAFSGLYQWLASPEMISLTNFVNEWALTLIGISLILGIGVRLSSVLGAAIMLLYYFPVLEFPYVGRSFIVDEHIIYATALMLLATLRAGRYYGLENWCSGLPICSKYPKLRRLLG